MKSVGLILSFLLGLSVLVTGGEANCVRKFKPPPEDDCSTDTGSGAAEEVPCLVYGSNSVQQPEFPEANTRTCYRTCHDNTADPPTYCQASLTGVHNQNIPFDVTGTEQTLFSPNYNDNKDYRKSTICRYDVTCPEDHLVTYMFTSHTLESRTNTCILQEKCVDYVKLTFPNVTDEEIFCGTEPQLNSLVTTSNKGLVAEFYANRYEEAKGFELTVICIAPGSQPTNRRKRAEMCTQVSNAPRLTVDSAQELSDVIMSDHVLEDLRSADAHLVIVNELEALVYSDLTLTVVRRRRGEESAGREESVGSGVRTLFVSSRFARSRSFQETADVRFRGYAELWISGQRAYLLQLGLNPIYKPTPDEEMVLVKLQQAINSKLECVNFFDVYDLQDAEEERVAFTPSVCVDHFVEDERLNGLAITYGNACNGLLRSVACSYQAVILQRNCTTGEPIYTTTDPTSATTDPTSATTSPTRPNTDPTSATTSATTDPTSATTDPTSATTDPTSPTTDPTSATTSPTTDYQVSAKVPTKDPRRRARETLDKM